jgi:transcription elongation factor GreA
MTDDLKVHLTKQGLNELQDELDKLKEKEPTAVERVTKAREFGDLSENSEYHAAREDLALIQGRIDELEDLLARAEVIRASSKTHTVKLGSTVTVYNDKQEVTYVVVGEYEADPTNRKISHDSPLGQALIGKKIGDTVEYEAPVGKIIYKIKHVA